MNMGKTASSTKQDVYIGCQQVIDQSKREESHLYSNLHLECRFEVLYIRIHSVDSSPVRPMTNCFLKSSLNLVLNTGSIKFPMHHIYFSWFLAIFRL